MRRTITAAILFTLAMATPGVATAAIDPETKVALDTVWVLFTAFLVFWMNAGFALVESGFWPRTSSSSPLPRWLSW
jgi:Amt family ammonium transporter